MIERLAGALRRIAGRALPAGSLGARFAKGTFWSFAGTMTSQGLGMVASIATARLLGTVGYGELGMVNSTLGTFGVFAGLGLGLTATKYVAEHRKDDPERAGRLLALATRCALASSGAIALALLALAPWLTAHTLKAPHLDGALALGCALLFFNSMNGLQGGALGGFEAFKAIARINFIRGILNFPLMIGGAAAFGLMGAVAAQVVVSIVAWWMNGRAIRAESAKAGMPVRPKGIGREAPVLWKFALPAFLSGIVVGPFLWLSNTLLARQPGGYGELGMLGVANQWKAVLMLLPGVFNSVALPMLSSGLGNGGEFKRTMDISQSLAIMIVLPMATAMMAGNRWIMMLYGGEYAAGGAIFVCLLAGVAIAAIGSAPGAAIQATGRMWLGAGLNLAWGAALVGMTAAFVPRWGGFGLALAFSLAYSFMAAYAYAYLLKIGVVGGELCARVLAGMGFLGASAAAVLLLPVEYEWALAVLLVPASIWLAWAALPAPFVRRRFWVCFFGE